VLFALLWQAKYGGGWITRAIPADLRVEGPAAE